MAAQKLQLLEELQRQKAEVDERLQQVAPRGYGAGFAGGRVGPAGSAGGRGGFGGRQQGRAPLYGGGHGVGGRGVLASGLGPPDEPAPKKLLSVVSGRLLTEETAGPDTRGRYGDGEPSARPHGDGGDRPTATPEPAQRAAPSAASKRPAEEMDPETRKRHRRLFGSLLQGTLKRFQREEEASQDSSAARQAIVQRAEARALAASRALVEADVQHKRQAVESMRQQQAVLGARMEEIALELSAAQWREHHAALAPFLCTVATPPLYWRPALPCAATDAATAASQKAAASRAANLDVSVSAELDRLRATIAANGGLEGAGTLLVPEEGELMEGGAAEGAAAGNPMEKDEGDGARGGPGSPGGDAGATGD